MPTKNYSNVTAANMDSFRAQLAHHGTSVPAGDSGVVDVSDEGLAVQFAYDETGQKLTLTIVKKSIFMPAAFIWSVLSGYMPAGVVSA